MTAARTIESYDARSPQRLSPTTGRFVDRWAHDAAALCQDAWSDAGVKARFVFERAIARDERRAFELLPEPDVGGVFRLGPGRAPMLITGRSRLMLLLVQRLLGAAPEAWTADRSPTPLERTLLAMLFERLAAAWSQSWPGRSPIPCEFEVGLQQARRARLFAPGDILVVMQLQLHAGPEPESLCVVMPLDVLDRLAASEAPAAPAAPRGEMAAAALRAPLPLQVELGRVQLTVAEAERLRRGDVLLFDQSIHARLTACVSGRAKFKGRPGRCGPRLCFAIEEVLEEAV